MLPEAENETNPLYKKLKLLVIFSSNLGEYLRVRVAKLREIKGIDNDLRKKLEMNYLEAEPSKNSIG